MLRRRKHNLILSIYANSRGFGFVLLEGQLALVDWGVREAHGITKNQICLGRIARLIDRYEPDLILVRDMTDPGSQRADRIRTLNREIEALAQSRGVATARYSSSLVRSYFRNFEAFTKRQIALVIARRIPALERLMPRVRRPWMSEDGRMGIFDAAALAFKHIQEAIDPN
jgi:hypothetical protein